MLPPDGVIKFVWTRGTISDCLTFSPVQQWQCATRYSINHAMADSILMGLVKIGNVMALHASGYARHVLNVTSGSLIAWQTVVAVSTTRGTAAMVLTHCQHSHLLSFQMNSTQPYGHTLNLY